MNDKDNDNTKSKKQRYTWHEAYNLLVKDERIDINPRESSIETIINEFIYTVNVYELSFSSNKCMSQFRSF